MTEAVKGFHWGGLALGLKIEDFLADALLLLVRLLVGLLLERVHAEDVDELRDDAKLPFGAESEPVEDAEDVEEEENEGDDGADQVDPLDDVGVSACLLDRAKTFEGEVSDEQEDATHQHQECADEIQKKDILKSGLKHYVYQS